MRAWQRACLYIRRKAGKSVLMLLVMVLLFSSMMASLLLHGAAEQAMEQIRQNIGGGFRVAPDMQNRDNVTVSEAEGQISVAYIGEPLDEKVIQAILDVQGIYGYDTVVKGEAMLQNELTLVDYSGKYNEDATASHLVSVEAHSSLLLSEAFQKEQVKLTAGILPGIVGEGQAMPAPLTRETTSSGISGAGTAVISEALAQRNGLQLGDEIRLSPREGGRGKSVSVKICGFFAVEAAQPNTDVAAPVYLLENRIFLDSASGLALLGAAGADYVDFCVEDPEQVIEIMEEIPKISGIRWDCFGMAARTERYERAAEPLRGMKGLADALLALAGAVSITVLSLMQTLFHRSRRHETGILLSVGISKAEILWQRFLETSCLAAAAWGLLAGIWIAFRRIAGNRVFHNYILDSMSRLSTQAFGAAYAMTVGAGGGILFLSAVLSGLWVMKRKPREILSERN